MNPRFFVSQLFVWLLLLLLPSSFSEALLQPIASRTTSTPNVLGRSTYALGDDFEDPNWKYDDTHNISSRYYSINGFWWGPDGKIGSDSSNRGYPSTLATIPTPPNGKSGSRRALKIGTNIPDDDNDPKQDDLNTIGYGDMLKRKLTRADQPVFVVRVLLSLFDTWGEYYSFGFRQSTRSNDTSKSYYPSIWLCYNPVKSTKDGDYVLSGPYFKLRIFCLEGSEPVAYHEFIPIKQHGWWTLAIAFDEKGVCSYYARPGVDDLTEENKIFDDTQFMTKYGKKPLLMDHVHSGLFSLGYLPEKSNTNLRFVIDDYEVWVVNDK